MSRTKRILLLSREIAANSSIFAKKIALLGGLAIPTVSYANAFLHTSALAQISPDETLGVERSVITPNVNIKDATADQVDGGATRGSNLFHSFREFNIKDGQRVYFSNPAGINNILGRVTGNNPSEILGTLGVNGNANLFLINPNGIIFGKNASLDLGGSFVASTANAIKFGDSTQFSAIAPQNTSLLTVTAPIGLQFGGNLGSIQVQGNGQGQRLTSELIDTNIGLRVQPNQTLALVGGNLILEGATLKTAGGRIELGSVAGSGLVSLTPIDTGFALGYSGVPTFGNIQFSGGAVVDASGAGGGDIQVQGRRVTLQDGSQIEASTLGAESGGTLDVTAVESIELIGATPDGESFSGLNALVYAGATGTGGNITVATDQLIVRDGTAIASVTSGEGDAGNLTVLGRDSVEVVGTSADGKFLSGLFTSVNPGATGDGGDLNVQTGRLILRDGTQIFSGTFGQGDSGNLTVSVRDSLELVGTSADGQFASGLFTSVNPGATGNGGNLSVETGRLILQDGAEITTETLSKGDAGSLIVSARDSVELLGTSADGRLSSALLTSVDSEATGNGGNLIIKTGRLILRNGAEITTGTFGNGDAGSLTISARDSVELLGTSADGQLSSVLRTVVGSGATGNGGNLTVETGRLIVRDGGQLLAGTFGNGDAGNLSVLASESVELIGTTADYKFKSGLFTSVNQGAIGDGGKLTVETGQLTVRDDATIRSGTFGQGAAGNLTVSARSIELNNQGSITTTATSGNGGNITMQLQDLLLLRRNSQISATAGTAQQDGNGGNITINAPKGFIVAPPNENSDITANAFQGSGGKVNINAAGIFGLKPLSRQELERSLQTTDPTKLDPNQLPTSDITAISQTNPSLNGEVNLNTPETDPSQGLQELPTDIIDVSGLINQNLCVASQGSEFIITGRGGLPPSPYEVMNADTTWEDWWILPQSPTKPTRRPNLPSEGRGVSKPLSVSGRGLERGILSFLEMSNNSSPQKEKASTTIIEAQGWVTNANGDVILTAKPATMTPKGTWLHPQDCHTILDFGF
jgi:filamentous hemagglutinin family protein